MDFQVGVQLKPFLPQLQPTLLKGLNDPARPVRVKAGNALGYLSQIHVRIDPIFVELLNGLKTNDDPSFKCELMNSFIPMRWIDSFSFLF